MHKVFVKGAKFYAHHGYFEEERKIGSWFEVNIEVSCDFDHAMENDDLNGTLNYASLLNIIEIEMKTPSLLLESLGKRILDSIRKEHKELSKVKLEIHKLNPPLPGLVDRVGIIIEE